MTKTFFTSDTHFGHANLVEKGYREFPNVKEMDETIIDNWNKIVKPKDVVWHLGDFTLGGADIAESYGRRLNGRINLIWGNHDRNSVKRLPLWASSSPYKEITVDNYNIVLCHYAMRVWNKCAYNSIMLYGHSHGNLFGNSQSLDVGVDAWQFSPVSLEDILYRLKLLPKYQAEDHHSNSGD